MKAYDIRFTLKSIPLQSDPFPFLGQRLCWERHWYREFWFIWLLYLGWFSPFCFGLFEIRSLHNWCSTTKNVDHVVETNATISLFCLFEEILNFRVLIFGEDTPLLVDEFFEILSTSSSHDFQNNICYISNSTKIFNTEFLYWNDARSNHFFLLKFLWFFDWLGIEIGTINV